MYRPTRFIHRRPQGIALVLVLGILVLMTAIVIAFLSDSTTDLSASKNYAETARARLLADSAVNMVEGQIRAGVAGVDPSSGNPLAWASQPGMIRTFDTSGNFVEAYKLYSSDVMQAAGTSFSAPSSTAAQNEDLPTNWNTMPSDFVDLNSPELIGDANGTILDPSNPASSAKYIARFPIIDGNKLFVLGQLGNASAGTNITGTALQGYDGNPAASYANDAPDIAGFSVQLPNTYNNDNNANDKISPTNNPVPMPVRWLYVLQNGELHARDPQTHVIADATSTNPVVGRMAFWTDDDTCKLNVNTASEGTFWDRPWVKNTTEENFAAYVPAQNEFQMYPGHPAKTCLSTVFGASWIWPLGLDPQHPVVTASTYSQWKPYYDLTPRVTQGATYGSAGGTQAVPAGATTGIPYDTDRLYASLDEIMFKPTSPDNVTRQARNVATADSNDASGAKVPPITPQFLETARFFLTASNRAPEVTLFNTPRISLWPIQAVSSFQTSKDKLLAFCSTIPSFQGSTNYYYFQRATATTNSAANATNLSSESPTLDMMGSSGTSNYNLYGYLKGMLSANVPGLGGNFQTKYGKAVTSQIATEMFDQIRSGVNTAAGISTADPTYYNYTQPQGTVPANYVKPPLPTPVVAGSGQVVPLLITDSTNNNTNARGFGRFSTIVEAAVVFFRCDPPPNPAPSPAPNPPTYPGSANIGAFLILQPFNPSPGFPPWSPDMRVEVSGLDGLQIQGTADAKAVTLGFPPTSTNVVDANSSYVEGTSSTEFNGLASMFYFNNGGSPTAKTIGANPGSGTSVSNDTTYPFTNVSQTYGVPITLKTTSAALQTFTFSSTQPIKINIYNNPYNNSSTPVLLQTLNLSFPTSAGLPLPTFDTTANGPGANKPFPMATILSSRIGNKFYSTGGRSADGGLNDGQYTDPISGYVTAGSALVDPGDVVRSIIVDPAGPSKGDYRVIAALANVPANYFTTHPFYYYPTAAPVATELDPSPAQYGFNWKFAHSLRSGMMPGYGTMGWYDYTGASRGNYLDKGPVIWTQINPQEFLCNSPSQGRKGGWRSSLVGTSTTASTPYYYRDDSPCTPPQSLATPVATLGTSATSTIPGDWDTGYGLLEDGPYINKPDEGNGQAANAAATSTRDTTAYFNRGGYFISETGASYSPNRQISSAVAFGSLPTGIDPTLASPPKPWQTLLFCPNPACAIPAVTNPFTMHQGFGSGATSPDGYPMPPYTTVPDHFVLDLFNMPIVEPYAISEPLSTQGKVNMNYQIAPFTYIRRDTGVRAVLKSTWLSAIPTTAPNYATSTAYKSQESEYPTQIRWAINPNEAANSAQIAGTLQTFEDRFNISGDLFRSASEICGVPLVPARITGINSNVDAGSTLAYPATPALPASPAYANMSAWWSGFQLTGDNVREAPYGDLYPRLTTKSNTFTVHVRVQALKKSQTTSSSIFIDPTDNSTSGGKDSITAECRVSYQIERYVDTANTSIPYYASPTTPFSSATPIDKFYKFRTLNTKQF